MPNPVNPNNKVLLIVLDGLGAAPYDKGNAVALAQPDNLIKLWDSYPHTYLQASGEAVGLPAGVYGNSEVGHMNLGVGKIVLQNLPKINKAIEMGAYFANTTLNYALQMAQNQKSNVHLFSCFSDGGVHSHIDHLIATMRFFSKNSLKGNLYLHCFTDGRDTEPKIATSFFERIENEIKSLQIGHFATICGRAFAMDRNQKWERTKLAYDLITEGKGDVFNGWRDAINNAYIKGETDEYISPCIIKHNGELPIVKENDVVIFLNYRADRAMQLTDAFVTPDFKGFQTKQFKNLLFIGMVPFRKNFPQYVIFPKEYTTLSLGRLLADAGKRQLRIAESEKFPHVTYFFNGGLPIKFNAEDRIELPSPNVATYDLKPEMASMEILNVLKQKFNQNMYDFILLNLANPDMVGHTGNLEACIQAVKVVDHIVGQLTNHFLSLGGTVIITSDHGNAEEVIKPGTDQIDTEHSKNPVPLMIINKFLPKVNMKYGKLADVTPTILGLMHINKPDDMIGVDLLNS